MNLFFSSRHCDLARANLVSRLGALVQSSFCLFPLLSQINDRSHHPRARRVYGDTIRTTPRRKQRRPELHSAPDEWVRPGERVGGVTRLGSRDSISPLRSYRLRRHE